MRRRLAAAVLAVATCAGCSFGGPPAASPRPSPTPTPTPALLLRPPPQAVLASAGGLSAVTVRDHLPAAEYAASAADQVLGLAEVQSWGWADASWRVWSNGGSSVDDLVVATDRPEGAQRAFAYWAGRASAAPLSSGPCPDAIAGLDQCLTGTAGRRTVVVGRLNALVFRLDVVGADAGSLAASQAQRLRAT